MSQGSLDDLMRLNKQLREQIELKDEEIAFLRAGLVSFEPLPLVWNLTKTEEQLFRFLLSRDLATTGALMVALYSDRPDPPGEKMISILVCKIRKKLRPFGVEIKTQWGRGFYLPADVRKQYREPDHQKAAA